MATKTVKTKKPVPLESSVVDTVVKWCKKQPGVKVQKTHGSQRRHGTPDLLGSWQGRMFAIEMKRSEKEKPTKLQQEQLDEWAAAGAITGVAYSRASFEKIIKEGLEVGL